MKSEHTEQNNIESTGSTNLYECLRGLEDSRRQAGCRHELSLTLLLVILSMASGYSSYRQMSNFIGRHRTELIELLKPRRKRLPSYSTIRRVLTVVDSAQLSGVLWRWLQALGLSQPGDWLAIDGKAIKGTVTGSDGPQQDFVALVSLFSQRFHSVLTSDAYHNATISEIEVARRLISNTPLAPGVIITMDALHCQKKLPT